MSAELQYLTDSEGEKSAVILPLKDYEKLMEDLSDLAAIADRRDEATVSHEEFVESLKADGVL